MESISIKNKVLVTLYILVRLLRIQLKFFYSLFSIFLFCSFFFGEYDAYIRKLYGKTVSMALIQNDLILNNI